MTIESAYAVGTRGLLAEVQHSLDQFSPSQRMRDPAALSLRAMRAVLLGDVPTGIAVLQRAAEHARGIVRQYLVDLLVPLLVMTEQLDAAQRLLDAEVGDLRGPSGRVPERAFGHRLAPRRRSGELAVRRRSARRGPAARRAGHGGARPAARRARGVLPRGLHASRKNARSRRPARSSESVRSGTRRSRTRSSTRSHTA